MRDRILIRYHPDERGFAEELRTRWSPLPGFGRTVWSESPGQPEEGWAQSIEGEISRAAAVVVLLSSSFLASRLIRERELALVRDAGQHGELPVFPVIADACEHGALTATFQAVHEPSLPLRAMSDEGRSQVWERLLAKIKEVEERILEEELVAAELTRLNQELNLNPDVVSIDEKVARAKADPVLDDLWREKTLAFLEGKRCMALTNLLKVRQKAITRKQQEVNTANDRALRQVEDILRKESEQLLASVKESRPATAEMPRA
jgi:hypothetical protein